VLRFLCFASLLAAVLAAGAAGGGSAGVDGDVQAASCEDDRRDEQGIRITMTGELPEDLQKKGEAPEGPAQG